MSVAISQVKAIVSVDQGNSSRGGKHWSDAVCILKLEPAEALLMNSPWVWKGNQGKTTG